MKTTLNRTDALRNRLFRIYRQLDRYARAHGCIYGWDMRTLAIEQPATHAEIVAIKREWRALISAGL